MKAGGLLVSELSPDSTMTGISTHPTRLGRSGSRSLRKFHPLIQQRPIVQNVLNNVRLLVFDWDGTVMDSAACIVACMRTSLQDLELQPPPDERLRSTIGLGLDAVLQELLPDADGTLQRQVIDRYRHHWLATFHAKPIPFAGITEALTALQGRDYLMAVATGKGRAGLDRDFEQCNLGRFFQTSRTVNESPSKPAPHMLLEIMDELGCRADETLVIGDTSFDLEMARNADVRSVAVLCGAHPEKTLRAFDPLTCLESARHLPDWLARAQPSP